MFNGVPHSPEVGDIPLLVPGVKIEEGDSFLSPIKQNIHKLTEANGALSTSSNDSLHDKMHPTRHGEI